VMLQTAAVNITSIAVKGEASDADASSNKSFYESDLLAAALRTDATVPITNVSLGTVVCNHAYDLASHDSTEEGADTPPEDGVKAAPLITLQGTARHLAQQGLIVAAAGNTFDWDVSTYPAAFTSRWMDPAAADPAPIQGCEDTQNQRDFLSCTEAIDALEQTLLEVGEQVIAVGASDEAGIYVSGVERQYSTQAGWVTTEAAGCHDSLYPSGEVTYVAHKESSQLPAETVRFEGAGGGAAVARWCGTSFAAAVVSAQLATGSLGEDDLPEASRESQN
ncbi:MAG: S8 family serine peptidase, partial [Actinomycetota bacterium]